MRNFIKYYTLFGLGLLLSIHLKGQNVDSLKTVLKSCKEDTNKLNVLGALIETVDALDPLQTYIIEQKKLAGELMKSDNKIIHDKALYDYAASISAEGIDFYMKGENEKAIQCFKDAFKLCEKSNRYLFLAGQLNSLASVYLKQGRLGQSLECYQKCMNLIKKTGDKSKTAIALSNIGALYKDINEHQKALEYFNESLKLRLEIGSEKGVSSVYNNIGGIYYSLHDTLLALNYFFKALSLSQKLKESKGIARSYLNLGKTFLYKKNYPKAFELFSKSNDLFIRLQDKEGVTMINGFLSVYYINQNQYEMAESYALKSLQMAKELGFPDAIKFGAKTLTSVYKHKGNSTKALEMFELYVQMQDSTNNEITRKTLARLEIQHEYEIKEAASKLEQEKKDAIAIEETKKQKIITLSIGAVLVLVFAFAFFAYRSFLRKRKDHIEISKQKEVIEIKQKEILDSIRYAQRIQKALITSEKYIDKNLDKLIN